MAIEVIQVTEEDITVTLTDVGIRGRAGLVFRGDYNDTIQYYQGDSVRFSNNLYIATGTPELGTDPTDSLGEVNTGWELLVFGSPSQTAIVDFHVQTSSGSIVFAEGDLIKGINGNYYWSLGSGTLDSTTILTNESNFEVRGNPVNTVGNGTISTRPASADEVGDFYVTDEGESSIWDGTQWLEVHTRLATSTNNGLMSSGDKAKLDGIELLAEANDKVEVEFSDQTITITSTEDAGVATDTATIPLATKDIKGLVKVDTDTLSINSGIVSADETLELGKLKDVTAPTVGEDGFVLRGQNSGSSVTYNWVDNNIDSETIQSWDTTGNTNYDDNTGSLGSSIVEYEDRLYMANGAVNYETTGSCSVAGILNRTQCTASPNNARWTVTTPDEDSNWNEIGPGNLRNLDDVDVESAESSWTNNDQPILSRVGNDWKLFPGLDKLSNIGDIPVPTSNDEGAVLTYDSTANPQFAWRNSIARIQDFNVNDSYTNGELVRSNDKIWLVVSTNIITASTTLPVDGIEWQSVGPENLAELNDTIISADVLRGDLLTYNGINWVNLAASQGIALSLSLTDIGDVPGNSILNKVLVSSENSSALAFVANSTYNNGDIATFGANYFKFVGADNTTVGTETPDNDTTNWAVTTSEVYTWEDYARNIKNIQPYSSDTEYLGDDLVQYQGSIYISLNSASATVAAPTGVDTDVNWNQLGASTLTHINDIPDASVTGSVLSFAGEVDGKDTYAWTTTIAASASVDPWDNTGGYSAGALVTHTADGDLSIFLNILSVSANSNGNTAPESDPTHWEIIGPEKITNLEDVSITNEDTNDLLQYNGNRWVDQTPAQVAATMELAEINRVADPIDGTDDNKVLQVIFSGTPKKAEYTWVDRTTNTTTIQGHIATKTYTAGELVFSDSAIYLAIGTATNLNKTPGTTGGEAFWQLIGPETFEQLEDSAIASPSTDQFIIYNSSGKWVNTDLVTETEKLVDLFNLKDVDGTASSNSVLRFDSSDSTWKPVTPASLAGNMNLTDMLDVGVAANVSVGDFIQRVASGNFEGVDSTEVAAQMDVGELKDVTLDSTANDDIIQRKGGVWVNRTVAEVTDDLSLDDLGDVGIVNDNEFIQKNGSSYDGKTISELLVQGTIDDLDDVTLGTLGDNEILQRKSGDWVNSSPATVASNMELQNIGNVSNTILPELVIDNPGGGKTAILMYNTDDSVWEAKTPKDVAEKVSLETLRNVSSGIPNGTILQKGNTGVHEPRTPAEIANQFDLGDIKDVTAPKADGTENGFVLRGNNDGTDTTYDWVSNEDETASIQAWDTNITYSVGNLVEYKASGEELKIYIARISTTGVTPIGATGSDTSWELLGPEGIDDLNDITLTSIATNNLLRRNAANDGWENVTPAVIAEAGIDLNDLKDVGGVNHDLGNIIVGGGTSWGDLSLGGAGGAVGLFVELDDLKGVDAPNTGEDKFVLRGNNDSGTISYDWVSNTQDTATIQSYSNLKTYTIGHLVSHANSIYLALKANSPDVAGQPTTEVTPGTDETTWETVGPESIEKLVGVSISSGANSDLLQRTGTDTWANITPADMAEAGIDLTDLKDVDNVDTNDLLQKTSSGWQNQTPAELATSGIDLSDLKDVNGNPTSGHVSLGDGDSWESVSLPIATELHVNLANLKDVAANSANGNILVGTGSGTGTAWSSAPLSTATNNSITGVDIRNLKNVDDSAPGTDEVLQFTGTEYESKDTDAILTTGHLASLGDVDSSPDLTDGTSSDLGKVLTVRKDSNDAANYVWEAPIQASIQLFNPGTTTNVVSYKVGDLVFVNDASGQKIWIAQSAFTSAGGALTSPPGTADSGGVRQWNLVGPEDIENLEDVTISGIAEGEILRYDNTDKKWKNVGFIDSTGLTGDDLNISFTSDDTGVFAKVDASAYPTLTDFQTASTIPSNKLGVNFTNTSGIITADVNISSIHSSDTADNRFLHENANWDGNVAYVTKDLVNSDGALWRAVKDAATAFDETTTYTLNDEVSFQGTLYKYNSSTDSDTTTDPSDDSRWDDLTKTNNPENDTTSTDWIKFMQTGDEGIPAYRDNVTYADNDVVVYTDGVIYVANGVPTGNPSTGTNWLAVASSTQFARATILGANTSIAKVEGTTTADIIITEDEIENSGFAKNVDIGIIDIPGQANVYVDRSIVFTPPTANVEHEIGFFTTNTATAKVQLTIRKKSGALDLNGVVFTLDLGGVTRTVTMVGNSEHIELDYTGLTTGSEQAIKISKATAGGLRAYISVVIGHDDELIVKTGINKYLNEKYATFAQGATADTAVQPADFSTEAVTGDDVAVQFTSVTDSVTGKIDLSAHPATETIVEEVVNISSEVYVFAKVYTNGTEVSYIKSGGTLPLYYKHVADPAIRGAWVQPASADPATHYVSNEIVTNNGEYWISEDGGQDDGDVGIPGVVTNAANDQLWRKHDVNPDKFSNVWKLVLSPVIVQDTLTSTNTHSALSANKGRSLSFATYSTSNAYAIGDLITDSDNKMYKVTTAITSTANTAFGDLTVTELSPGTTALATATTNGLMSASQRNHLDTSLPPAWKGVNDTTTTYPAGRQVSYLGTIYSADQSIPASDTTVPTSQGSWRTVGDVGVREWNSRPVYNVDSFVSFNGEIYKNLSTTTGANASPTDLPENWEAVIAKPNPTGSSETTTLTSIELQGKNYDIRGTSSIPEFITGTGVGSGTAGTGILADGFITNGYVRLYFPHVLVGSAHRATDVTFNQNKYELNASIGLTSSSDLQRRLRFVNNNAETNYSSAGAKSLASSATRYTEFWYSNYLTSTAKNARRMSEEIIVGTNANVHDSAIETGAVWAIDGTVDPVDHEFLILKKSGLNLSVTAFVDFDVAGGLQPLGIEYENIAAVTSPRYTPRTNITYVIGDLVRFLEDAYMCTSGYTTAATANTAPDRNTTNWTKLSM